MHKKSKIFIRLLKLKSQAKKETNEKIRCLHSKMSFQHSSKTKGFVPNSLIGVRLKKTCLPEGRIT